MQLLLKSSYLFYFLFYITFNDYKGKKVSQNNDEGVPFYLATVDTMPSFQGEGMQAFSMWLNKRIVVDTDGSVKNVTVEQGVCEELALMLH